MTTLYEKARKAFNSLQMNISGRDIFERNLMAFAGVYEVEIASLTRQLEAAEIKYQREVCDHNEIGYEPGDDCEYCLICGKNMTK